MRMETKGPQYMIVKAEDRLVDGKPASTTTYTFDLHWNAPSEEAEITEFTLDGFEGAIKNTTSETRTITVNVPYGTDVKGMWPSSWPPPALWSPLALPRLVSPSRAASPP